MKTTSSVLIAAVWIALAASANANCKVDEPGDSDNNPCKGAKKTLRIDKGVVGCCMNPEEQITGGINTKNGRKIYSCRCTGGQASSHELRKRGTVMPLPEFREQGLHQHNVLRARHGCGPLKLSDDLNRYAQRYAVHLAKKKVMKHSNRTMKSGEKLGENLAWRGGRGVDFDGKTPVQLWYDEIKDYDFNKTRGQRGTGHFTQVVWKGTSELGMGKARTEDGNEVYVCASYRKPGNVYYIGNPQSWKDNVPRPLE